MRKILKKVNGIFDKFELSLSVIGGIALIMMMLLIVLDILLRNFMNSPIKGGKELVELLMIIFIFFGYAYTQKHKGHIGIDFIIDKLKGLSKRVILTMNLVLTIIINVLLTYFLYNQVIDDYRRGVATIYLQWPKWIITLIILIGIATLSIRLLLEIQELINYGKDEAKEGGTE